MNPLTTAQSYSSDWSEIFIVSLQNLWIKTTFFIPELVGALVILIIGLIIASVLGKLAKKLVGYTRIDKLMEKAGIIRGLQNAGIKLNLAVFIGKIVKWFILIATLIAIADILRIPQITEFLKEIIFYIPNVIVAVIILAIGLLLGALVQNMIEKTLKASKLTEASGKLLANIAKWAIIIFTAMAALIQLGIAASLIEILFTGLVAMLALAGGLAFGIGGKEKAARFLEEISKKSHKDNF